MLELHYPIIHLCIVVTTLIAVWYFGIIKPQHDRHKEAVNILNNLALGKRIITISGTSGTIVNHYENVLIIKTDIGALIEITPWSVKAIINVSD